MKFNKEKKGFTLIELLVVISIIGVLSTIVLSSLGSARDRVRDTKKISDIKSIQTALEMYHLDNNSYPTGVATINCNLELRLGALVDDGYLPSLPVDDGQRPFCFNYYGGDNYSVWSCDGKYRRDYQYALFFSLEDDNDNVGTANTSVGYSHCVLGPEK